MKNHKTTEERKAMKRRIIAAIIASFCCSTIIEVASRMNRPEAEVINEVINEETISTPETSVSTTNITTHTTTTSATAVTTTTLFTTSTKVPKVTTTTETDTILTVETELQNEEPIIQENPEVIIHTEPAPIIQAAPTTKEEITTSSTTEVSTTDEMTETNIETAIETTSETSMENTEAETYLGYFRITGYVATGCKTASGTWPEAGRTIAMNATQRKNLGISFGDKIRIEGLGEYIVEDSGCKSGVIDVFCNSVSACYALTSHADVYLIKQ